MSRTTDGDGRNARLRVGPEDHLVAQSPQVSVVNRFVAVGLACALSAACGAQVQDSRAQGSAATHLKPRSAALPEPTVTRTVYVPVYSTIYLGVEITQRTVELGSTLSVRNVSARHPLVLNYVRYYDSAGKAVREYVEQPSELAPLASVEFVVLQADTTGGPGANFLVNWTGPADIDEPLIETIMIGQHGNAGISFTSPGRVIKNEP